jgi:RimJ/RimL family protein N-acetyltransferase
VSEIQIRPIDPRDTAAFDAWHAVYLAAESFGREGLASPWQLEEYRVDRTTDDPHRECLMYSGVVDGEVVVVGDVEMRLDSRPDQALLQVFTHPDHRRRGYGSRMLVTLEVAAHGKGRRLFDAEAAYPYDGPADGSGSAGVEFARRHEYAFGLGDVMRVLDLPVTDELIDRLLAEAAPHHASYSLRSWVGPLPDELVEDWTALNASLDTEAPVGDLEKTPEPPSVEFTRSREALIAAQGRTMFNTVAIAADGTLAGYTDIVTTVHEPGRAYQWGTLVAREHRGHKLGLAMKAANLRLLQTEGPPLESLTTYNAEVNSHMIAVNEALGFRPVERLGEFQKKMLR